MDAASIVQVISQVGFPIAACVALFWKINKQDEAHAKESKELTEAINNNTLVVQKLIDKLDGGDINGTA